MNSKKNKLTPQTPFALKLNLEVTPLRVTFNSNAKPKSSTSSFSHTSSIIIPSPKNSTKANQKPKKKRCLISTPNKIPLLKEKIITILKELSPRNKHDLIKSNKIRSSSQNNHRPSIIFQKGNNQSLYSSSSSALHKPDLSLEMSQNFIKGTGTWNSHLKLPFRFTNFNQIRNKIINDFTLVNKPSSIELSKYYIIINIFSIRNNYNQTLHFIEDNRSKIVQQGRAAEKFFYDLKKGYSYLDKKNPYTLSFKTQRMINSHSESELKTQAFQLLQEDIDIIPSAKERFNKPDNWKEQIDRRSLDKNIKIIAINKLKYDEDNDDLIMNNIPKLKQIVEASSAEARSRIEHFQPMFMKQNFKSKTIRRFKSASGNYFGVP